MVVDPKKNTKKRSATRQKILEAGFRLFAEKTINAVNLTDVAEAAGVSFMTVYRHFDKKPDLVLAINTWSWEEYRKAETLTKDLTGLSGAEGYEFFLDSFIDLYVNYRDTLRYNQYFTAYVKNEKIPSVNLETFDDLLDTLKERFHVIYTKGQEDGTLRTDCPENEIFSATLHLMLAVVTRYAVGLAYDGGINPLDELKLLKKMMMEEYTVDTKGI